MLGWPCTGCGVGEDGGEVKHRVLRVWLEHEVELAAVPAFEPLFDSQAILDFRRQWLGDAPSLTALDGFLPVSGSKPSSLSRWR